MKWSAWAALVACLSLGLCTDAAAQCPVSVRGLLDEFPPVADQVAGHSEAPAVVWDRDGTGPQAPVLAFGRTLRQGSSSTVGGVMLWDGRTTRPLENHAFPTFARWNSIGVDPQSNRLWASTVTLHEFDGNAWNASAIDPLFSVYQFASWNGQLFATGDAYGTTVPSTVARLDNGAWSFIPRPTPEPVWQGVLAATSHGGELVVAVQNGALYAWNGSSWRTLFSSPASVAARGLASFGGSLWLGGYSGGGLRVFKRVGNQWVGVAQPDTDVQSQLGDLIVFDGDLYAAGRFVLGVGPAFSLLKWTGSSWDAPGNGTGGAVQSMGVWQGRLCAYGAARDKTARLLIEFDGERWTRVGPAGYDSAVPLPQFFMELDGARVAGGSFRVQHGAPADYLARLDASGWHQLGQSLPNPPLAMCVHGGSIVAAVSDPGNAKAALVVRLSPQDGSWETLGRFVKDESSGGAVVVGLLTHGTELVAFGAFGVVTGQGALVRAERVAVLGPSGWTPRSIGPSSEVVSVARHGAALWGLLRRKNEGMAATVARWSEEDQRWLEVGDRLQSANNGVQLLFVHGLPCVAPSSYRFNVGQMGLKLQVDGHWQTLMPDRFFTKAFPVDEHTVAVCSASLGTSVQLLRFSFSADVAGTTGGSGDGVTDGQDLAQFADWMTTGDLRADFGSVGGTPIGDDRLDTNDWQVYFDMYFGGCR